MKALISCCFFFALYWAAEALYERNPPKVQVYSRNPGEFGKDNFLVCYVSEFHPPDISIELMQDGVELPNSQQTDLAFKQDWHFHLTRSVGFNPKKGDKFLCRVNHGGHITNYEWEANM